MIRRSQWDDFLKPIHAVLGAAFLLFYTTAATAQTVSLRSDSGALELTGRVIGYDGDFLQIETRHGLLTVVYDSVTCRGAACPDPETYTPAIRLSGSSRMAEVLIPALLDGFARSRGWTARFDPSDARLETAQFLDDANIIANISIHSTTAREGFADLIAYEADAVLSVREAKQDELQIARDVGVGRLAEKGASRVIGLDALVPVVHPSRNLDTLSLSELVRILRGDITSWADLGGATGEIELHLPKEESGLGEAVVQLLALPSPAQYIIRHDDQNDLSVAVSQSQNALGISTFGDAGTAKMLSLSDACGLISTPSLTALKSGDYPLSLPLFVYLPERRLPRELTDFLSWLQTPSAQLIVRRSGFVDQGPVPVPIQNQGQRFVTAIERAGPDITLGELQRLVRILKQRTRLSVSFRFEVGSTRLTAQSRANLIDLATAISRGDYTDRELMLIGFSDGRGSALSNRELSSARAEAVKRDLVNLIDDPVLEINQIETEAFGEALPMGCDDTEWGRQTNRRVELWVSDQR